MSLADLLPGDPVIVASESDHRAYRLAVVSGVTGSGSIVVGRDVFDASGRSATTADLILIEATPERQQEAIRQDALRRIDAAIHLSYDLITIDQAQRILDILQDIA